MGVFASHAHFLTMAAYANGVGVTDSNSSPPLRGERRGNHKAEGDSHSSLVHQSQRGRHYGTVGKGKVRENGHLIHSISSSDTLQGIALKYGVTVIPLSLSFSYSFFLCCLVAHGFLNSLRINN